MEESTFTVEVPAGVDDGSTLRLADRGAAGQRGGRTGSLFVHLAVTPDPRFEREGDNLHTTLTIGFAQAALGTEVEVATLEGTHHVVDTVGHPARVRRADPGRGRAPPARSGPWRPLRARVVETPSALTDAEEELLRQFAALRGEHVSPHGGGGGEGVFSRLRSAFG